MAERGLVIEDQPPEGVSALRAWVFLVWLGLQRQARARQMVWIGIGLLAVAVTMVGLASAAGRWGPDYWTAFRRFSGAMVFEVVLGFLLPLWSMSFATQGLGSERESRSLLWLLTRPLPRPAVYLAKFVACLPWSLGLTVGGFALVCLAAGRPGRLAFQLYWPAIFWGTLAYAALFFLIGACLRRPAVVALVYAFFLETFLGSMPGHMKRVSVSFYTRCLMFDVARQYDLIPPQRPAVYLPVSGTAALWVLAGITLGLVAAGTAIFSWMEFTDLS